MERAEILSWLRETDEARLQELWQRADLARQENVGGEVHLRGLIELSNYCIRLCGYCGLRAANRSVVRYRMTADEVIECVDEARRFGYGTVVLQSGEDPGLTAEWVADVVRRIKTETPLAVTLSLGERDLDELALWRMNGADRYLLRFETSNRRLYDRIHPPRPGVRSDRIALLGELRQLGYEVGSGVMIGIPGQTYNDLADDIEWFGTLNLDMIGVGPYLVHPETPLGQEAGGSAASTLEDSDARVQGSGFRVQGSGSSVCGEPDADNQVPNSELMTYKVVALARLVCPRANIPATTALATLNKRNGRELGLTRGANVVMPNLTPVRYRALYEIYPDKACLAETAEACNGCLTARIQAIGRQTGSGRGDSPNYTYAEPAASRE